MKNGKPFKNGNSMKNVKNYSARNARKIAEENSVNVALSFPCNGVSTGAIKLCNKRLIMAMKHFRSVAALNSACKPEGWSIMSTTIKTTTGKMTALTAQCPDCHMEIVNHIIANAKSFDEVVDKLGLAKERWNELRPDMPVA